MQIRVTVNFTDDRRGVDWLVQLLLLAEAANADSFDVKVTAPRDGTAVLASASDFLHSAAARGLSLEGVLRMSEEEAYRTLKRIRWHDRDGEPQCPRCGCVELYDCRAERRWKCKDCSYRFSVTSGTIFDSRKMAVRDILAAIALVANGEKRISALQMSRELDVTYKTALDLAHRIRGSTPRATGSRLAKSRTRGLAA